MPGFVAAELIVWLNEHKIIRPDYTTLQKLVSEALSAERRRLGGNANCLSSLDASHAEATEARASMPAADR